MSSTLSTKEHDLIAAMSAHAAPLKGSKSAVVDAERQLWLAALEHLRKGEQCGCGTCPSFKLELGAEPVPAPGRRRHILGAGTATARILLFIDDGIPSELEIAPGVDPIDEVPDPSEVYF